MCEAYEPSDFSLLLSDLCDDSCWDVQSTSIETSSWTSDSCTFSSSSSGSKKRKTIQLDKKGNRKLKVESNGKLVDFEVHFPRTRVVATDIRRSFANMFVNVMNSGESTMMAGFLDTFVAPNISRMATKTYLTDKQPFKFNIQSGIHAIVSHWFHSHQFAPDTILRLMNTQLFTYSDVEDSKLVSKFRIHTTRLFEDPANRFSSKVLSKFYIMNTNDINSLKSSFSPDSQEVICAFSKENHNNNNSNNISRNLYDIKSHQLEYMGVNPQYAVKKLSPEEVVADGEFTMFVDGNKRITRIEMSLVVEK